MNEWLWFGGEVSLDFVNTVRDRADGGRETLLEPARLATWLEDAGLGSVGEVTATDLEMALRLRDSISRLLENSESIQDADISLLNLVAAGGAGLVGTDTPQLQRDPAGRLCIVHPDPTIGAALRVIALNALEVYERGKPQRIKTCAHDHCGIAFYDSSRAGSRRWCSMERCGNRAKVAKHAAKGRSRD